MTTKKQNSRRTKVSSFAIRKDGKVHIQEKSADCVYCSEAHSLDRCNVFMNQKLKEKIKFLKLVSTIFSSNFYFSPNDSPSKTIKTI